jgi:hypothetical protein
MQILNKPVLIENINNERHDSNIKQIKTQDKPIKNKDINISDQNKIGTKNSKSSVNTSLDIVDNKEITSFYKKTINPSKSIDDKKTNNESVFYINGILTKSSSAEKQTKEIAELTGKPITLLYNPTEGFVNDVIESAFQVMNINTKKSTVNDTAEVFYQTLKSGKELKVVAHSQGAAITAQALTNVEKRLIHENNSSSEVKDILKKVTVVTIGGAASKSDFPSSIKYTERKNKDDIVPKLAESTGTKRPEDLLYKIKDTKDSEVEQILWSSYEKKANDRSLGKICVAIKGATVSSISVACEYISLKTGINKTSTSCSTSDIKLIDVINKNHDALPNTSFNTGYLVNNNDRKIIADSLS